MSNQSEVFKTLLDIRCIDAFAKIIRCEYDKEIFGNSTNFYRFTFRCGEEFELILYYMYGKLVSIEECHFYYIYPLQILHYIYGGDYFELVELLSGIKHHILFQKSNFNQVMNCLQKILKKHFFFKEQGEE